MKAIVMKAIVMKAAVIVFAIMLSVQDALADETVKLHCTFEHGTLEININYTRETANDSPAMITDKEVVWSPGTDKNNLAIINRYTGVMRMGNNNKEYAGMCKPASQPGK